MSLSEIERVLPVPEGSTESNGPAVPLVPTGRTGPGARATCRPVFAVGYRQKFYMLSEGVRLKIFIEKWAGPGRLCPHINLS